MPGRKPAVTPDSPLPFGDGDALSGCVAELLRQLLGELLDGQAKFGLDLECIDARYLLLGNE